MPVVIPFPSDWEPLVLLDRDVCSVAAAHLIDWATNDRKGEQKLGDRAHFVTGGHNRASIHPRTLKLNWPSGNSSCGDLDNWLRYCLGHRGKYVNRESEPGYTNGWNNIRTETHPAFVKGPITGQLSSGDSVYSGDKSNSNSLHMVVVVEHRPADSFLAVGQYGQSLGVGIDGVYSEYPSDWHPNVLGQPVRGLPFDGQYLRAENQKTGVKKAKRVIGHLPLWEALQWASKNGMLEEPAYVPPGMPKP